jgi:hypothetical protein
VSALVIPLAVCLLVGVLLDRGLLGDPGLGWIERFGRGLMLGLGAVGSLSLLVDAVGLGVSQATLGGAVGLLVVLLARPAWRVSARMAPSGDEDRRSLSALTRNEQFAHAGLLLLAVVGLSLAVTSGWLRPTYQFDAITRWMFKAKALHVDGTLFGAVSMDPYYSLTHQRYPPLVSHVANLPALLSGVFDDRIASAIFPWYAVALVAAVYGALRRRCGALTAALGAAWIGNLPLLSFILMPPPGAGAASAMADIPLSLFIVGTVLALADGLQGRRARGYLEAGLMLGFAALSKNEGLPFVAGIALAVLVAAPRARLRCASGVAGLGLSIYLALWGLASLGLPITDEHYLGRIHVEAVSTGLSRLGIIFAALGDELMNFRSWNLTWAVLAFLLAMGGKRLVRPVPRMIVVALAVQCASYAFAYVVTSWSSPAADYIHPGEDPLPFLLQLTLGRLLMQVAPAAIVLALIVSPLSSGGREARSC